MRPINCARKTLIVVVAAIALNALNKPAAIVELQLEKFSLQASLVKLNRYLHSLTFCSSEVCS